MTHRVISSLSWARPCDRPKSIPRARAGKGTKGLGIRFERSVSTVLGPKAKHGQWFEFWDRNGRGFCQPDIIFLSGGNVYIVEVKLTNIEKAQAQLTELYIPVVSKALESPARGIIVTKYVTRVTDATLIANTLTEAIARTQLVIPVLHYIGIGPI